MRTLNHPTDRGAYDPTPDDYRERLRRVWGISMDEVTTRLPEWIQECESVLRARARQLDPTATFAELLQGSDAAPSTDTLFAAMRGQVERARTLALSHMSLPPGESCEVWPVSEQARDSFPWGGYNGPDPLGSSLRGNVFLNQWNRDSITPNGSACWRCMSATPATTPTE